MKYNPEELIAKLRTTPRKNDRRGAKGSRIFDKNLKRQAQAWQKWQRKIFWIPKVLVPYWTEKKKKMSIDQDSVESI